MKTLMTHRSVWWVNLAGGLVAVALALGWFWIPDSSAALVIWSGLQGAAALLAVLLLIGATISYLRQAEATGTPGWREAFAEALRKLPRLVLWAAGVGLIGWLLVGRIPAWLFWPLAAAVFVPAAAVLVSGSSASALFRKAPWAVVAGAAGTLIPWMLFVWRPAVPGLAGQAVSLALRLGIGYVIATAAWVWLASLAVEPKPEGRAGSN
ncbi:MAG: hypothetical protein ACKV22_25010 [Bryobacteraceae bacterium]